MSSGSIHRAWSTKQRVLSLRDITAMKALVSGAHRAWRVRVHLVWAQLAVIATILLVLPFGRTVDPDFWWHLRTGRLIFSSGVPRSDPFSWTAQGNSWVAHEWLSEAVIFATEAALGYAGNVVLFSSATLAALGLMYALGRRLGAGTRVLVVLSSVAAAMMGLYFIAVRPQVFTWLLFAVFVYVLQRRDEGDSVPLWPLPPLTAIWVNLHLGFVYGLMVVSVWLLATAYRRLREHSIDLVVPLAVTVGCLLATLVNPRGPAILSFIVRYIWEGQFERSINLEWQRPYFDLPVAWPLLVMTFLIGWALLSRSAGRPFLALLSVVAVVLSVLAARNAPFVAFLAIPVVGAAAADHWRAAHREADSSASVRAVAVLAASTVAGGVLILVMWFLGALSGWQPSHAGYPSRGAAYIQEELPGVRLLNDYNWGGYLIDQVYPSAKVFVDGRTDLYGPRLIRDYATLAQGEPGWQDLLARYEVEAVLMPSHSELSRLLRHDPAWQEVVVGDVESLFVRGATGQVH